MGDRRIETVDDADGDDRVEIFRAPVLLARRRHPQIGLPRRGVAAHRAAGLDQRADQRREQERGDGTMHQQRLGGAAIPVRRILALTTIFSALSKSAARST